MTMTMHLWSLPLFGTFLLVCSLVYLIILKIKGRRKTIERSISTDESNIAGVRDSDPECPDNDESSRNRSQCHLTFDRWVSCPRVNTETPKTHKKKIGIERYFILWTQKITLQNLIKMPIQLNHCNHWLNMLIFQTSNVPGGNAAMETYEKIMDVDNCIIRSRGQKAVMNSRPQFQYM